MTPTQTVSEIIQAQFDTLTRAERQLANSLLENYPVSGLSSITNVAENAKVSTPTVARMVQKLGFKGFPEFQANLRGELEETISNPITKHDRWFEQAPDTHIINRFADAAIQNLRQTLSQLDLAEFDAACSLLSDIDRSIYMVGGRITRSLADYFYTHMQVVRQDVTLLASNVNTWPHHVLNMNKGDVLVIFDIRRYEHDLTTLATMARERGVEVILFTDQWGSPTAKVACHKFNIRVEAPSAWDSTAVILFLVETMISAIETATWDDTKPRMAELEQLFDQTRLFRKFI